MPSLASKIERYRLCAPAVMGVCAWSSAVAPSYCMPVSTSTRSASKNELLMLMTSPARSKAKLAGAVMFEPLTDQVLVSSSAMNASLNDELTNSGYSSLANMTLKARQSVAGGTVTLRRRIETSFAPRSWVLLSRPSPRAVPFGPSARAASPDVIRASVDPVGAKSGVRFEPRAAWAVVELQATHCWPVTMPASPRAPVRSGQACTVMVTVAVSV